LFFENLQEAAIGFWLLALGSKAKASAMAKLCLRETMHIDFVADVADVAHCSACSGLGFERFIRC
jgi:hypothetical protein